ncbi:MAG: hypothetical protein ACI4F7_00890 [Acutalibacteraceae bacterium]
MNFYEKEMRTMFGDTDIIHDAKFCGRTMLGKLDDELRVKLQLISTFISGQYNAVQATVINRTDGTVDKQTFKFADIIGKQKRNNLDEIEPHIWEYNGKTEWYIPVTATQKAQIADTVLGYVEIYQDESMEIGSMNM